MPDCSNCLLHAYEEYVHCNGSLSSDQCIAQLKKALAGVKWDLDYVVQLTDSVYPSKDASVMQIKEVLFQKKAFANADMQSFLLGEGTHKEGICPVCGGAYKPLNFCSTGRNLLNHNWRCPDCGASGRTVYESDFLGHFDLVDGNGKKIETAEDNDHNIYTCPCCGEPFGDDDFFSDGYWDHGSGSYGETGCRARGRAVYSRKFRYHADVRANRRKVW